MAIHKAQETLCYVHGCGSVVIESAQIHFETGGGVAVARCLNSETFFLPIKTLHLYPEF
jgi:hypothetical protein